MSKPFDYSKWDNIEISDDEDDCHPNIEKESWFRLKHRSRVEREEREEKDKKRVRAEMKANEIRIKELRRTLKELDEGTEDDSDDELEDVEGLQAEMKELVDKNLAHQAQLDYYEKNKKWNVDNMCTVSAERTIVSSGEDSKFDAKSGYAIGDEDLLPKMVEEKAIVDADKDNAGTSDEKKTNGSLEKSKKTPSARSTKSKADTNTKNPKPSGPELVPKAEGVILAYPAFVDKYEDILEKWMTINDLESCKEYLLLHGDVLLQENASSYLLLASLEDEMNGFHQKMLLTSRQAQILTNIAELAKTMKKHPGNVIVPFFTRMQERVHFEAFMEGVNAFVSKVKQRAVVKKKEIDEQRAKERAEAGEVDLNSMPREQRLGPGGLDPVEVFESLPIDMQEAFESRDTELLKKALLNMPPADAEMYMDKCIKSGLWNEG
mmetsp:Transcript_20812/g.26861  ORF Transcript_20812/g.26861 Transcript_20812/m.26861 type:complete len:435 (-) Transcript_20812:640-1944(-)|eukprot:CAMPEP_0116070640 /NCGR_PEP_ID=MMETSP0322-20121206/13189_1 /TAXON_ID=163516 /ORGANISM="Leptocylindrus danicus var. apora, Strain B651" /LENGTH=434 /DNA_ID=CAMNT_0003558605 /DNA_START=85 /DNA_END=1389 /DNA_ORIENTATION=-